jgi:hypothetical protein
MLMTRLLPPTGLQASKSIGHIKVIVCHADTGADSGHYCALYHHTNEPQSVLIWVWDS